MNVPAMQESWVQSLGQEDPQKRVAEDEKARRHHQFNGHELEQTPGDSGGQRSLCVTVHGVHGEMDMTELLSNKNLNTIQVLSRTKVVLSAPRPKISQKFPRLSPEPVMLRRLQLCGTCVSQPPPPRRVSQGCPTIPRCTE